MRFKKAFTMAEAIIVMTILGIIATIMITNLKPAEFRDKGLKVLAKKTLMQLDTATQQIMINNTQNGKLTTIYAPGTTNQFSFSASANSADILALYKKYVVTTRKACTNTNDCGECANVSASFKAYLKDGACIGVIQSTTNADTLFPEETTVVPAANLAAGVLGYIFMDVNGLEEPNVMGKDQFKVPINSDGIFYD